MLISGLTLKFMRFPLPCFSIIKFLPLLGNLCLLSFLLPQRGSFLMFESLSSNLLSHVLLLFFLFLDHLKFLIGITSFSNLTFLIIFMIDLSVVLVLAASSALLTFHAALLHYFLFL